MPGGYSISGSIANSTAMPQNVSAGTVFNFSSPGATTDWGNQTANPILPATATSSAAQGDAAAATSGSGVTQASEPVDWQKIALYGGGAVVALAIIVVIAIRYKA